MRALSPAEDRLVSVLAEAARGPKRDGVFGLWLVVRCAEAALPPMPVSLRNHRRRVVALGKRLSSLTLPAPLRRALQAACVRLELGTPEAAGLALYELIAPARETLGPEAGDAVRVAAETARTGRADGV